MSGPAFVYVLKEPALSLWRVDGAKRSVDGTPCQSTLSTFVEERDVAEAALLQDVRDTPLQIMG